MIIKALLIASVLVVALWLRRGTSRGSRQALSRIGWLVFGACWVAAVLAPNSVTVVANLVGVGRGTDLVLYILVVAFMCAVVGQWRRYHELDDRLAQLTRANALLEHELRQREGSDAG